MSNEKKIGISTLMISVMITGSLTFLISQHFIQPTENITFVPEENDTTPANTQKEELKYFRDKIILTSESGSQDPWALQIDLNRKENSKNKFIHYYSATFFQSGEKSTINTNFYSNSPALKANRFLQTFENKIFDDLSTRETYNLSMNISDKKIDIELKDMDGDFITKNDINYTRYLSAGKAKVTIEDQIFQANATLEKTYSADNSKSLFFPGINNLTSRTYRFLIWDEDNNFYLLDDSIVSADNPYYKPHTWVLYKNFAPEYLQKAFSAEVKFTENGDEKSWKVSIPDLKMHWDLSTTDISDSIWYDGVVSGTISKTSGTKTEEKKAFGVFSFKRE